MNTARIVPNTGPSISGPDRRVTAVMPTKTRGVGPCEQFGPAHVGSMTGRSFVPYVQDPPTIAPV